MIGASVIPLTVIALRHDDVLFALFARTISGVTTGPHLAGAWLDWPGGEWRDWLAVMDGMTPISRHVALSPPGIPMFYGGLNALLEALPGVARPLYHVLLPHQCHNSNLLNYSPAEWASAWFGMLMPLWAALAVFPLYGVARLLDLRRARWVVLWWPLVPALAIFTPTWNTFYPLLTMIAFWLLLWGLPQSGRGLSLLFAAGVITGLLTFANFSLVPLVGFFGLYLLLHVLAAAAFQLGAVDWRRFLMVGALFTLGVLLPWTVYVLLGGASPVAILQRAMTDHLGLDRAYLPWLVLHGWEWALLTGLPLIALWLLGSWRARADRQRPAFLTASALLLLMAALLISGVAQGETGRVWLFLAPFVLLAAADVLDTVFDAQQPLWIGITLAQAALLLALAISWDMIAAPDIRPRPPSPDGVAAARPAGADFAGEFRLAAWEADVDGDAIILRLDWQGRSFIDRPYWFSALLVGPEGVPVGEALVWQPLETRYPTTCWAPGEWVGDQIRLPLPPDAASGEWWISLAAFADATDPELRLPVFLPDGSQDTQIGLGPIRIPAP